MKTWTEVNFDVLLEKAQDKFEAETEAESVKHHQEACDILQKYLNNEIKFEDLPSYLQQKIKSTSFNMASKEITDSLETFYKAY